MIKEEYRSCPDFDAIYRSFSWDIPEHYNAAYDMCDQYAVNPSKIALIYEREDGLQTSYTFERLRSLSNQLANALTGLEIQQADRIGVLLPQGPEAALLHLAALKTGVISVPMTPMFGPEAIVHRMNDCRAKALVISGENCEKVLDIQKQMRSLKYVIAVNPRCKGAVDFERLFKGNSENFRMIPRSANDPAFIIYTSGTTGLPKGALHAHRCIPGRLPGLEMSHDFLPRSGDFFWTPADWAWVGGLFDSLMAPWTHGIPVLASEKKRFDPERAFRLLEKYQVKNAFLPPTALKIMRSVPNALNQYRILLRSVHSGGETLPADLLKWGQGAFGVLNEIYGMTEMGFVIGNSSRVLPVKPGSMGKAYPGHRVEIIDENGQILPAGRVGEIAVHRSDPGMFLEYWGDLVATKEKFKGPWMCTQDLAVKDEAGYFWYKGRKDDVITSAGYRIGPTEVENCIFNHPAVNDAAVVASPDPVRGSIVKAFVLLKPDVAPSPFIRDEIQTLVKKNLAAYEYPREIEFVKDLPRTVTGKIQRHLLRELEIRKKGSTGFPKE